jgi:hypothetical protein
MKRARYGATATLLPDGRVLVVGNSTLEGLKQEGWVEPFVPPVGLEVFDPAAGGGVGAFAAVAGAERADGTVTLLKDGRVLLAGGLGRGADGGCCSYLDTAEVFDPTGYGGAGSVTATGRMTTARIGATAALLPDGRVLVAGGVRGPLYGSTSSAEIFDPAGGGGTGTFTATGRLVTQRTEARSLSLPNGKVLVLNGDLLTSAELFDPQANGGVGGFTALWSLATGRWTGATVTLLPDSSVLVAGGDDYWGAITNAELYTP